MVDEVRRWRCREGHVLGLVVRNGRGVRQLWLYREAVFDVMEGQTRRSAPTDGWGKNPEVMAVIEGYAADVRCSECGAVRTWVPGAEGMRRILERMEENGK